MRTVITTCDQCLIIINKQDVQTGKKFVPAYIRYMLDVGGIMKEFCSMHCLEGIIHKGEANPAASTASPVDLTVPVLAPELPPQYGEGIGGPTSASGYPK